MVRSGIATLHLFAGGGGGVLADRLLGRDIVGAVEIEKYPREILLSRQADGILPLFPIWDDVTTFRSDNPDTAEYIEGLRSIREHLCIAGGFPCFAGGTLILTEHGYRPIESVSVGDAVLTHKGRWRKVTKAMCRDGAEIWKVKGFGIPDTYTTAEHPYYCTEWGKTDKSFISVSELDIGKHCTAMVLPDIEYTDEHTPEWWWLAGRYLADGWRVARKGRRYGRVVIACPDSKLSELQGHIKAAGYNASLVRERTCNKLHITKGDFYRDLEEFGHGAGGKHLTRRAYCLPVDKAEALYEGYMSGDGRTDNKEGATSISKALILDMCILAQRLGKPIPAFYESRRGDKCVIEGRECNQNDTYAFRISKGNNSAYADGRYVFRKLREVRNTGIIADVYNLSVEEDESYVANGAIVHNCQDISVAGKGAGLEGARSGLWSEMLRIIGEVGPRYILVENSPMLVVRGLDRVAGDLAELGYCFRWGTIGADDAGAAHRRKRFWLWGEKEAYSDTHSDGRWGGYGNGRRITTENNFRGVSLKWLVEKRPDKFWPANVECYTEDEINE